MLTDNQLFLYYYNLVRPTVLRLRGCYHVRLWNKEDWEQEAMLALYQLLLQVPVTQQDEDRLRVYFKTKFSNYVKDQIRRQESQKRRFDRMAYEDCSELAHLIPSHEPLLDEQVAFQEAMSNLLLHLSLEGLDQLYAVMAGQCFKGKRAFLRRIRPYFEEVL